MNTANSKTKHSNKFVYNFTEKLNLKSPNKNIALANLSIYYTWKNVKSYYNNNKFKISAPTWAIRLMCLMVLSQLLLFKIILNILLIKHETIANVSPVLIYVNKINNRIVFKIKSGYKLELLSKEAMRLLESSADTIDSDKNSELVPKLESVDLFLVHCNLVNNSYQQASKVLFTFVPNKKYGQLFTVSPNSLIMLKTIKSDFSFIEIWFTDQDNRPLEVEDSVNISLIISIVNFM